MKLSEYLGGQRGRAAFLAKAIGAHAPDVSRWSRPKSDPHHRPIPAKFGPKIEQATSNQVTRQEMFDDWRDLWPELPELGESESAHA